MIGEVTEYKTVVTQKLIDNIQKRVDELIICDITPNRFSANPNMPMLKRIFSECDMPVTYGGGISNYAQASEIFHLGCEKLVFNTTFYENLANF